MPPVYRPIAALATAAALLLTGCASGTEYRGPARQTPIPEDSVLVLAQALELPSGRARVYLQDGRVVGTQDAIDRFQPGCSFGLERVGAEPLLATIEPDRFRTGRPRHRDQGDGASTVGIGVSGGSVSFAVGIGFIFGLGGGGGSDRLELPLSSPRQPQVDDFTCTVDRPRSRGGRLGLEAIEQAAGDLVRVELAADPTTED